MSKEMVGIWVGNTIYPSAAMWENVRWTLNAIVGTGMKSYGKEMKS
jgi:hypothetical protein